VVRAAGGVLVRRQGGRPEVLLVHRPRYDDWSFPKGKARRGETDEECALREVEEETSLVCELEAELPATSYRSRNRPKRVRYWLMRPCSGDLAPRHEVDTSEWLGLEEARRRLSYEHDRALLDAVAEAL
jgi:8-oxo-dGTP diphosphatase